MDKSKIIKIKKLTGINKAILFILVPLKENQVDEIKRTKQLPQDVIDNCIEEKVLNTSDDIKLVLHIGELSLFTSYRDLVYEFPRSKREIIQGVKQQFRDYSQTLERQKASMHLVACCTCLTASWRTALTACGSKHGIILKIHKDE